MSSDELIGAVEVLGIGFTAGVAALPHCAAMCGPLCASACGSGSFTPPVRYQLGRTLAYAFAGSLAARFGLLLRGALPPRLAPILFATMSATACLWVAYRMWPRHRSAAGGAGLVTIRRRPIAPRQSPPSASWVARLDPSALGALTALLPCSALYGALMVAAATGSGFRGALLMTGFAIAGAPLILGAGALAGRLSSFRNPAIRRCIAVSLALASLAILVPRALHASLDAPTPEGPRCH